MKTPVDSPRAATRGSNALILATSVAALLGFCSVDAKASPGIPLYWEGGVDGTWTGTNWTTDAAGTIPGPVPSAGTDAIFSATGAANQGVTTLGQAITIHSLTINDPTPVVISSGAGGPYTLTMAGDAGTGLTANPGTNVTINSDVTLGGASDTIAANGTAAVTITGTLGGSNGLIKNGAGTLTLTGTNTYTGTTTINAGTLQLATSGQSIGGPVNLAGSTAQLVLPAGAPGLVGQYYNVATTPDQNNFVSLTALQGHLSTLTPAVTANSILAGANFDFGNSGQNFPAPYNTSSSSNFEAEWTGQFNAQTAGTYNFFTGSDDGSMLFVDGTMVVNNNFYQGVTERGGTIDLTAGVHNIVIAFYQASGGYGMYASYTAPGGVETRLPNSLLLSQGSAAIGALSGVVGSQVVLNGSQMTVNQDVDGTFAGTIVDGSQAGGSLIKSGSATLTLTGNNTYTGGTTITTGTLQIGNGGTTGSILGSVVNNGTLIFSRSDDTTFAGNISGTGSVTKNGAGTLTYSGANTYSGSTTINAGTLALSPASGNQSLAGAVNLAGSTARLVLPAVLQGLLGQYYNTPPNSSNFVSLTALQSHLSTLTPAVTANSSLAGANFDFGNTGANFPAPYNSGLSTGFEVEWTGEFNAQTAGTYSFFTASDDGSMLFVDGAVVVNNNFFQGVTERSGTVTLTAGLHNIVIAFYQGGAGYGMDALYTAPGGVETLLPNSLLFSQPLVSIGALTGVAGSQVVLNGSQLTVNQDVDGTFAGTIVDGSTTGGSLIKSGAAALTLSGANTYTGSTTVTAGTLQVGDGVTAGATLGSGPVTANSGATFALNLLNGETFGQDIANNGHVVANGTQASSNYTLSGAISGTGDLTKNGGNTVTLTGNNSYTGGTTINAGALQVGNGGTSGNLPGDVVNNGTLIFNRSDDTTYGGAISGTGAVTKNGAGTLTWTAVSTYTGSTTINTGTLQLTASALSPGSQSLGSSVNLAGGTARLVLPAAVPGLVGQYYTLANSPNQNNFTSLNALQSHLGGLSPTLTANSSLAGANFDFANTGANFPAPYNTGTVPFFEAEWTGQFNAQTTGAYNFFTASDDGSVLFIDGTMVVNNNFIQGVTERGGTINLTAGLHNIIIGFYQNAGGFGLDASYTPPGGVETLLPNSLLSLATAVSIGALSGVAGSQVVLDGSQLTVNQDVDGTFAGAIVDGSLPGGALVKAGAATLLLTGDNTYTGSTTIAAGTLQLGNGGTSGGVLGDIVDNAALIFDRSDDTTYSGNISGTGSLTKLGTNTLTLTGNSTFTGLTTITAGTLQVGNGGTSGSLTGDVVDNGALIFNRSDNSAYAGNISGSGTVTKNGAGTLTFSGSNTYTGVTTINAGTLQLKAPGAGLGASLNGPVNLAGATARLTLSGQSGLTGQYFNVIPTQADFVSLNALQNRLGTLTPALTASSNLAGANFDFGTSGQNFPAPYNNNNASDFEVEWTGQFNAATTGTYGFSTASDDGSMIFVDGVVVVNNNAFQGVTERSGTVTLTAGLHDIVIAFYQGGGGEGLQAFYTPPGAGAETLLPNSLFNFTTDNASIGSLTGVAGSQIVLNGGQLDVSQTIDGTFAGSIVDGATAGGQLIKDGGATLTLSGANTYTGGTTINAGVLQIGDGGTTGSLAGDVLDNTSLVFNRSDSSTYGGVISGTGSVTQAGTGTLTLTSANTYTGATTISAGTIANGIANALPTGTALAVAGTLDLAGFDQQVASVTGNGAVTNTGAGATFTLNNSSTDTFAGAFTGNNLNVTKAGAGTLILTGASTHGGTTDIQAGLLQVDGSLGNTSVTVENGATLGGKGTITGSVTVASGGTLAPGDSPGTIHTGTLLLSAGSISNYQLGTPGVIGSNVNDLTVVTGNLTLGGTLNIADAGGFGSGAYQLFQYSGALTNNGLAFGTAPAGFGAANFTLVTGVAHEVDLIVVPGSGAAIPQFWDGAGPANNASIDGGTATWSNFSTNFADAAGDNNAIWQNGVAVFSTPAGGAPTSTVTLSGAINFAGLVFNGGGYTIVSDGVAGTAFTAIGIPTNASNLASISVNGGVTATIATAIGGTAGISKDGAGTLIFSAANSYSGGTTLNAGTLQLNHTAALGAGDITMQGGILRSTVTDTFTNNLIFSDGTSSTVSAAAGQTLTFGPNAGTSFVTFGNNSTATFGSLTDTGTVVISSDFNNVAPTANVVVAGGTLRAGNGTLGNALGNMNSTTVNAGATLDLNDQVDVVQNLQGAGHVIIGTNAATNLSLLNENTVTADFGGVISGPGSVEIAPTSTPMGGTTILSGNNTYTGGTTIDAGETLQLGNGGASGSILNNVVFQTPGPLTLATPGVLAFNRSNSYSFTGTISGPGSVAQAGAGTTILTGPNTYSGGTTINAGTLLVNNPTGSGTGSGGVDIKSGGTLGGSGNAGGAVTLETGGLLAPGAGHPGAAGTTLHANSLTWNGGASVSLQLGATADQFALTGALTKGTAGTFTLILTNAGITQPDFTLATFASTTFAVSDFTLVLPVGVQGILTETATSLQFGLTVTSGGPIIENTGPVFTATFADFVIDGPVTTGSLTDNNTIKTLTFTPGGSLLIHNTLFVTQGPVILVGGSSITLDGSLSASQLRMLFGSLLNGNGSIIGDLINAGLLSPGHSPGQVHVTGNYTQTPTGTLQIQIGGRDLSQHDLLSVGGTAALDGTLQLVQLNHFKLKRNKPVPFLTANGGVTGRFSMVENGFTSDTILEPTVVYHTDSVALEAIQGSFAALPGLTANQQSVARALDSAAGDRRTDSMFAYLDGRQLNKLPGDLDKIAPEELTSIFTIGTSLANVQSQNIQRRNDDIRSGSSGFNAAGLAVNGTGPSYSGGFNMTTGVAGPNGNDDGKEGSRDSGIPQSGKTKSVAPVDNRWGAFLSGTGEWVSVGNTDNARGYDLTSGGFTLGLDYKVTPNFAIGLMAGYTGTSADLVDRGRVYVNGGKIGVYATTFVGGWYADAAVNGGYNSYDTRRSALQGEARGDTDGGELNALFGTGYDIKKGHLTFGPTASFNYTYLGTNEFTEHGSLAPLNIHGGKGESLRTAFGIKASYDWKVGGVLIKPEIRAAWQHEYGDAAYALDSSFANGAGGTFTVNGPQLGRDSALLGAGFAIQLTECASTYLYHDGELGRTNYQSTSVTGGVRLAF